MSLTEWLQAVLNASYVVHNGEKHPASDIYSPAELIPQDHAIARCWRHYLEPEECTVKALGDCWEIVL